MLEFWGMWSTPSLPLLPGPLWPGVVVPDRVLSMGQIELNCVLMLRWCPHGVMVKALDRGIAASKFKPQLCYYIHFQINTLGKGMTPPYPPGYGLNSTTTVLLEGWLWHWITYKGWYAIKQRNQTKPNLC